MFFCQRWRSFFSRSLDYGEQQSFFDYVGEGETMESITALQR